ncbi:phytoene desaturase family protein [Terriglobus roseus]|uniref:Phytoene desaturase n=1 Tax=Terriglobus roseus TaxID=392734 RepID=A0A1G7NNX5_9BACT|nr:phytoene desaturase family protein [Terriglobus roseus]SDF75637.1 phytoene desaturase [Terriglobus roseus]
MSKKIAVVGGGPGGLAAAMLLSSRGFQVDLFEKQDVIGGRNAELKLGSYRFDLGPTFLMMKFLLDELFEETGRSISDYLDCRLLDPMYRLTFKDKSLLARSEPSAMQAEIDRVFPGEGIALERFLKREGERFEKLYPCLQKPYGTLSSMVSRTLTAALPHIAMGRSLFDVLGSYFKSEELRLAFTFQSKYLGMSPWDCPGLFAMIPYTEHAHGIYHVQGGLCRISDALARVANENGARIHTSTPVRRVLTKAGTAVGVELVDGEKRLYDDVVLNADFGYAMGNLFEPGTIRKYTPDVLSRKRWSCSTFMMYLGVDKTYPDTDHHTIVFARDYKQNLKDISQRHVASEDISVYVRNSVITDPSTAPAGHSSLYILVPVPNNMSGIDWGQEKWKYRERVFRLLAERTPFGDLQQHIVKEVMVTPSDWEHKQSVYQGATFNMGHNWAQMLYLRPHNKFEEVDHCYLVGGGTHPGSGLPTIFESARIAANLICDHYGVAYREATPYRDLALASV